MYYPVAIVMAVAPVAQAPSVQAQVSDYESWDTQRLYQYGTDLLKRGRRLDRAIATLSLAARREPINLDYQLTLGCAYASRFASVSQALRQSEAFEREQKDYHQQRTEWENAQNDPARPEFGSPPPIPPLPPSTPDDARRFEMSKEEALKLLSRLGHQSVAAFDEAHRIAERASPERRSEAEYTRAWGLFLLRRFGVSQGVVQELPTKTANSGNKPDNARDKEDSLQITQQDVTTCFRQCTLDDQQNSAYWHSLGLSLVPNYLDAAENGGFRKYLLGQPLHDKREVDEAISAFRRALSLRPNNFDLLYQFALIAAPAMPEESVDSLERAARRLGINAVLWYLLAEQRFRQAEKQSGSSAKLLQEKAVVAIESGNIAPQYRAIAFVLPVPVELKKAWDYRKLYGFGDDARVQSALFSWLSDYVSEGIKQGDDGTVLRGVSAMMGMGLKAVGSAVSGPGVDDLDQRDPQARAVLRARILMGMANCYKAYELMKQAQQVRPDERKARFIAENADLMKYLESIEKEVMK